MDSELSLEETNKLRISLGLAPLGEGPATNEEGEVVLDKEQEAEANYQKRREEDTKAAETKALQDRINKVKNKRELAAKLTGTTLGEESTGSAAAWAKQAKKKAKQLAAERALAEKRAKDQEELDELGKAELYSEKDLSGLKVGHDVDEFDEGEHILTLKDSRILDGEEDELTNADLARAEFDRKKAELKKSQNYTGYDDDEFDPSTSAVGMKKKVLTKYDVDIDGEGELGFRLGGTVAPKKRQLAEDEDDEFDSGVNRTLLAGGLSYEKNTEVSDYLQEGDIGFKKPKKKKKRSARVIEIDEESRAPISSTTSPNGEGSMEVDGSGSGPSGVSTPNPPVENFVDDDELQAALARERRKKNKKVVKLTAEDIARQAAEQKAEEEAAAAIERNSRAAANDNIHFDDTTEFVRTVQAQEPVIKVIRTSRAEVKEEEADIDLNAMAADGNNGEGDVDMEGDADDDEDEALALAALRQGMSVAEMRANIDKQLVKEEAPEQNLSIGTAQEAHIGRGIAGALSLLKASGNLAAPTGEDADRERTQKERDLWLADRRRRLAQRELERIRARGENKDQATREYENRMREQREAADALESFKSYKPDVQIVYHDEFGRELTPKEAWKALSHRFHGKGSGKGKTDKRLNKIIEERKRAAMSMGDTSMSRNFTERQERTGEAYMVLTSGNKGTIGETSDGKKRK
ncbi:U4/U6.U5 snRNP associated protein [Phaffia rhodozyma]|uniref:U4/U6.U5 snRNP associated protein n=1 Tax=Phaffia rhodozyma TaxID=264483 RepID=A0A0F7SMY5_PHARH|nr:U4/U6.U5 snRNP associated protein [Phaffia rhodozyma]